MAFIGGVLKNFVSFLRMFSHSICIGTGGYGSYACGQAGNGKSLILTQMLRCQVYLWRFW